MKFEHTPGIPGTIQELAAHAESIRGHKVDQDLIRILSVGGAESSQISESIRRLSRRDAVVVIANLYSGLLGGPVGQILTCLTAMKVCEQLLNHSINAVPVAWVNPDAPPEFSARSINLLDDNAEIHLLEIPAAGIVPESISGLLPQIADLGKGMFDLETLDVLRKCFIPGRSFCSANAHLFSTLMRDWGMIVIDPADLDFKQTRTEAFAWAGTGVLPVLACVVSPMEIDSLAQVLPSFDRAGLPQPMVWPQTRATIGNARSRRALDKYHLNLPQLYQGEMNVSAGILSGLPRTGLRKLEALEPEIDARMVELQSLVSGGKDFSQAADSCRKKVLYQIDKLRDHFNSAMDSREDTARRRIRKACNWMAPNQGLQSSELAGIQIPLTYSLAGLRILHEKLDILNFEHQLIWMD
jgi:uncharacterized protein YllA (UPF0747 family)